MTLNKKIGLSLLTIIGVVILFYLAMQEEELPSRDSFKYRINQPEIISYENAQKRWHIIGLELEDPGDEEAKVIIDTIKQADLYNNQQILYNITADQGIYYQKREDLKLLGNVILTDRSGDEIRSEELYYQAEDKILFTESGVLVNLKGAEISATKMEIDVEAEVIDFKEGVEMNFELKSNEAK